MTPLAAGNGDVAAPAKRVGISGLFGSHSQIAATGFYKRINIHPLFDQLTRGNIDTAFVPVENTLSGTFYSVYDLLARNDVHITYEYITTDTHHLLAVPGVALADVREVVSHPAVLEQCRKFLESNKTIATVTQSVDTAYSAQQLQQEGNTHRAVIASREAAELYGLSVLAEDIADSRGFVTRYAEVSRLPTVPARYMNPKTTISFTVKNSSGTLFKVLSAFALRDINISKIETRPSGTSAYPWELVFYLTADGGINEETMKRALVNLEEYVSYCRVLGSYGRVMNEQRHASSSSLQ
ncbi:hypothetical protein RI367_004424 [Sorochytrium milnesiophthora]